MKVLNTGLLAVLQSLLCLQALASPVSLADSAPTVDLGYAQYQGAVDTTNNITNFLGIRYASPPVGNLRWAAPQAPPTMSGVQQATQEPNECYQASLGTSATNPLEITRASVSKRAVSQSEDCLFLNVHVPGDSVTPASSGGLPVVVWIHGGGYIGLSASSYDGSDLVKEANNGIIAVVIQYRLGLFGFLPGAAVKEGGALNAGLLDQNYALQWVQSHIASFGGDPSKVTIWGESAGAGSVLQHLVAHGGNTQPPLFRAAMTSSTYLPAQYNYSDRIPEMLYNEVVSGTSCGSSSDTLSCLRAADVNTLSNLNNNINSGGFYGTAVFVPVVDGTFIVERPTVTITNGRLNGEALYAVTNAHEGNNFVNQSTTLSVSQYIRALFPDIQPSEAGRATPLYAGLGTNVDQANYVMGESIFVCPTYYLLKAYGDNAWKGEFAIPPALHGNDIGYYFTTGTSDFITAFSNSFMAMVMSMNPGDKYNSNDILPATWNSWSNGQTEMMFNVTDTGAPNIYTYSTDSALQERCQYWLSVAADTAQ